MTGGLLGAGATVDLAELDDGPLTWGEPGTSRGVQTCLASALSLAQA